MNNLEEVLKKLGATPPDDGIWHLKRVQETLMDYEMDHANVHALLIREIQLALREKGVWASKLVQNLIDNQFELIVDYGKNCSPRNRVCRYFAYPTELECYLQAATELLGDVEG